MRELCAPFYVDDGTGRLMIYPEGAELQIPTSCELAERFSPALSGYSADDAELSREYCLKSGDEIFVLGARLSWKSILYIWGGPVATLWGLWEILERAKAAGLFR